MRRKMKKSVSIHKPLKKIVKIKCFCFQDILLFGDYLYQLASGLFEIYSSRWFRHNSSICDLAVQISDNYLEGFYKVSNIILSRSLLFCRLVSMLQKGSRKTENFADQRFICIRVCLMPSNLIFFYQRPLFLKFRIRVCISDTSKITFDSFR